MGIEELLLDFRITSRCHLNCGLCFRNPGIEDHSLEEAKAIIAKIAGMGFRRIGFTGGEPTIRDDYLAIISYAKKLGFLTYLSTVGTRFIEDLPQLESTLDWIGLPLDGIDYQTNLCIRSAAMGHQHETIATILKTLSDSPTRIKIKLTTVVSGINVKQLAKIVSYTNALPYKYDVWRFYQFCPLGLGKNQQDILEIPTELFLESMQKLQASYPDSPLSSATFEQRDKANVLMEPNFDVIIPDGDTYTHLCNMQTDSEEKILHSITSRQDIMEKCEANRFWVK